MSSVFKWMEKDWPFSSSSEFVCFANINSQQSYPVLHMEIKTSLSNNYEIELVILSQVSLDKEYLEKQVMVEVNLFPENSSLHKTFFGYLTSFSFHGTAYSLVEDSSFDVDESEKQKNIYSLTLRPYLWNAEQKNKTVIFHKKDKPSIVESVLKPYKTKAVFTDSKLLVKEVVTQYQESDFKFAVRLMEESGYFCYYDFSSKEPVFRIKSTQEVSSSSLLSDGKSTLNLVSEIHDNFDFDQIINLKIFDKSAPNVSNATGDSLDSAKIDMLESVKEEVETNESYTCFSCECSSFNLFSGDYFSVKVENNQDSSFFLISPLSIKQSFFIEKSKMVLAYDKIIGWYIRSYLEGFISDGAKPEYRLERTTSTPIVSGAQKAYVCGYIKNSLYVNSEGLIKVRLTWIPFKEGTAEEKAAALSEAKKNQSEYIERKKSEAAAVDIGGGAADDEKSGSNSVDSGGQGAVDGGGVVHDEKASSNGVDGGQQGTVDKIKNKSEDVFSEDIKDVLNTVENGVDGIIPQDAVDGLKNDLDSLSEKAKDTLKSGSETAEDFISKHRIFSPGSSIISSAGGASSATPGTGAAGTVSSAPGTTSTGSAVSCKVSSAVSGIGSDINVGGADGAVSSGIKMVGDEADKIVSDQVSSLGKSALDSYRKSLKNDLNERAEQDEAFSEPEDFLQDKTAIWSVENSDSRALTGWIPLSQWGGSGNHFGNYSFPRVGQVVSVSFLDGNPDFPIVSSTSYSIVKKNSSYEEEMNFPYAITSDDDFTKDSSNNGEKVSHSFVSGAKKSVNHSLKPMAKNPALMLDNLEGVAVPDLIPRQCRKDASTNKSNQSEFEKKEVQSASGNLIIKSYAYDDNHRTNRAGWNEISFFNERYNEALRITSGHYLFLHSRDIVHFIAPKLLKEQIGIHCTTVSGNKYEIISGKNNEFFGSHHISYYPGPIARQNVESNDGVEFERLQAEVASKFMGQLNGFLGTSQIRGTFLNDGLFAHISFKGDFVALALGGSLNFVTLVGAFSVYSNSVSFKVLGMYSISVAGYMSISAVSKFNVSTLGTMKFKSKNSIHLTAKKRIHMTSSYSFDINAGKTLDVNSNEDLTVKSLKSLNLESGKDLSIVSAKGLSITATKSISLKTLDLSIEASSLSIKVAENLNISSAISLSIKSTNVKIEGAIIKLG